MTSLSFLKETIIENGEFLITWLYSNISLDKITINHILKITWSSLNGVKEATLAAIIFDTAFQMFNYNIKKEQKLYLDQLAEKGLLYILTEDKRNNIPRIWFIRGDACADFVDDLKKYRFSKTFKYEIKYTDKQASEILSNRKSMKFDDSNSCFCDDNIQNTEYYFYFTLIDLEHCYVGGLSKEEVYDYIKEKLILLPSEMKIKENSIYKYIKNIILSLLIYRATIKRFDFKKIRFLI